jgi:hypothetical protein
LQQLYSLAVNFNVYVDAETAKRIAALAKQRQTTRNAIVREAIESWLAKQGRRTWSERVIAFEGRRDFPGFEMHRKDLADAPLDPFVAD